MIDNDYQENPNWFENESVIFRSEDVISIDKPLTISDTFKKIDTEEEKRINLGLKERTKGNDFSQEERAYARKMIRLGFEVYREPELKDCNHLPDFYIFDPKIKQGFLVEITKSSRDRLHKRKKKQLESLQNFSKQYSIPFLLLCKEDLDF